MCNITNRLFGIECTARLQSVSNSLALCSAVLRYFSSPLHVFAWNGTTTRAWRSILLYNIPVATISEAAFTLYADPCVVEVYIPFPMMEIDSK